MEIFKNCKLIDLPSIGNNSRGFLSFMESETHIPFKINRVYYIHSKGDPNEIRGPHAHKETEQVFFVINGSAEFHLDDGSITKDYIVDSPSTGIFIGKEIWHSMSYASSNVVILVVASNTYMELDYLRNYEDFRKYLTQ